MPSASFTALCIILVTLQALAALPWLAAIDLRIRQLLREAKTWGITLSACLAIGVGAAVYFELNSNKGFLGGWGRFYLSMLHLQLAADLLVLIFVGVLLFWPKGGAVAQAAFREGMRQPMFWALALFASLLMGVSPFIPYFTFGEDLKMVKDLCYAFTMMSSLLFGVASAAMFVHEEIEGRTAVTVMSKPISRRQFFLGKYLGIVLSALAMTMLVGWLLIWVILLKQVYESGTSTGQEMVDAQWIGTFLQRFDQGSMADLVRGLCLWFEDAMTALPFIIKGFCQVMVLVAIATSLATRLPMVVNLTFCLVVYFLGNLAPIMVEVTTGKYPLVHFVAQVFQTITPGLELFDVSSAITRDAPLPMWEYSIYTMHVVAYALTYSGAALLFGLILFEDRDLA